MRLSLALFASLLSSAAALTFSSPSGGTLDPTQPITITWSSSGSDPSTFDIVLNDANGNLFSNMVLASSVSTRAGSYILPANTAVAYGSSFVFQAQSAGAVIGTSPSFELFTGSATTIAGQPSYVSASQTYGSQGTATTPKADAATTGTGSGSGSASASGSANGSASSSASVTGFETSTRSASGTSSGTGSTSGTSMSMSASRSTSATASGASATTSANAQPRLELGDRGQLIFSLAGVIAGMTALFV